jgi:hypothetical protein
MKNKDKIKFLLREGLSLQTVSNLNEAQLDVLTKKFKKGKKEESKEQTQVVTQIYDTKKPEEVAKLNQALKNPASLQGQNIQVKETEMTEDQEFDDMLNPDEFGGNKPVNYKNPQDYGTDNSTDPDGSQDGMPQTESIIREKFESKAQQNFFWAKCNTSKGVKKKKWCEMAREFSDSTSKKQYEKMPEKLHPEKTVKYKKEKTNENLEKFLENKIISVLESKVKPRMKKSDLVKLVQEKSESMILRKPKKVTMFSDEAPKMKTPIAKLFSIGKTKK